MKLIGELEFPTTRQEALKWRCSTWRVALAARVLVVAKTRIEGTWCGYCNAVPGKNHEREESDVFLYGDKLPEDIARAIFPDLKEIPYAK